MPLPEGVVQSPVSTSNHNSPRGAAAPALLFNLLFLHQTTTLSIATSSTAMLFNLLFLHQTTTDLTSTIREQRCSISCFYIKPQLPCLTRVKAMSCSISCFYIKPQRSLEEVERGSVVQSPVSTSNHNRPYL